MVSNSNEIVDYGEGKYYFIAAGQIGKDVFNVERYNVVTKKHPMVWLKDMIKRLEGSGVTPHIEFYEEITAEHYHMLKDVL